MTVTVALAGSVGTSRRILEGLRRHDASVVGVLGLAAERSANVSGYERLDDLAREVSAEYVDFVHMDEPAVIDALDRWKPDVLFVVGLSQLVGVDARSAARVGCVGFHPTALPKGRGRAPIAWIILDGVPAAASFFELVDEADAGGILVQEPFDVAADATVSQVLDDCDLAIDRALDRWLPSLLGGTWEPVAQVESMATWYGRRAPADGVLDWAQPAEALDRLVRASGRPYPGAFTYVGERVVRVWAAHVSDAPIRGVVGRIVAGSVDDGVIVQTGDGLLVLDEVEIEPTATDGGASLLRTGIRLGRAREGST